MTRFDFEHDPDAVHGGDLTGASRHYGVPLEDWIDLSTGISPFAYPFEPLEPAVYQRLPYPDPALPAIAAEYYGNDQMLPTPGSQAVIQALPETLPSAPVLVPDIGYREHARQWRGAGQTCHPYPALDAARTREAIDQALWRDNDRHLVIIQPNNPTGQGVEPAQLLNWARCLAKGRYLIVDEAFIDTDPDRSVLPAHFVGDNIIVLRSFGKFFGLAGIRLGFVFAAPGVRRRLEHRIGPWSVNGPAQSIARQALADRPWQSDVRTIIRESARWMADTVNPMMTRQGADWSVHEALFSTYRLPRVQAERLQERLGRQGILIRLIELEGAYRLVRIGRIDPADSTAATRLRDIIDTMTQGPL